MSLLDRLDALAEAFDYDGVERAARAALPKAAGDDAADLWRYIAWACFESGRMEDARAAAVSADDALYEAKALFHDWQLEEAARALARFEGSGEDAAEAAWYRGLLAQFGGRDGSAEFAEAARGAPELFHEPVPLTDAAVDAIFRDALAALPADLRKLADEAVVEVRPLPGPHPDVDPLTLGLYVDDRSRWESGSLPPRVQVFRQNVERIARSREEAADELRITLLHELGHLFGFDERGLDHLGLA